MSERWNHKAREKIKAPHRQNIYHMHAKAAGGVQGAGDPYKGSRNITSAHCGNASGGSSKYSKYSWASWCVSVILSQKAEQRVISTSSALATEEVSGQLGRWGVTLCQNQLLQLNSTELKM